MKQARRAYRHLPAESHEQALEQAGAALLTGAPPAVDRRTLYAQLAQHLDEALRRIHVGWCLNQTRAATPGASAAAPVEPASTDTHPVTAFIEDGLGGLERAVLQLELGAGRDTHTVRAALRLGPTQYGRHRELGLGKLRGAISGGMASRVCEQHLEAVTLAATGDRGAADRLASGPERCRACAREAATLRRVLQQRLALAPWPFAIKPAGLLVAKLSALGAALGGKTAAGGAAGMAGSTGGGAKVVAALVATAAVATGGVAAVERDRTAPMQVHGTAVAAPAPAAGAGSDEIATTGGAAPAKPASRKAARKAAAKRRAVRRKRSATAPAATTVAQAPSQPSSDPPAGTAPASDPSGSVGSTVDRVKKTVDRVTGRLPLQVPAVDELIPGMGETLDSATGAVDELLAP